MKKKITSLILILTLALTMTLGGGAAFAAAATQRELTSAFNQCGDYLYKTVKESICGSTGREWLMDCLAEARDPMSED